MCMMLRNQIFIYEFMYLMEIYTPGADGCFLVIIFDLLFRIHCEHSMVSSIKAQTP